MTAFITRCFKSINLLVLLVGLALVPLISRAESIEVRRAEAELTSDGQLSLSTRFGLRLPSTLSQALAQGVALNFRLEFELTKPRLTAYRLKLGNWFDPTASIDFKLSYHSLTNRYRVSIGSLANHYATLNEALNATGAITGWRVLDLGTLDGLKPGDVAGRVRLVLDFGELPKPFQFNALGSSDWALSSGWTDLNVQPRPAGAS